jgi:hypothetical protein
MSAKTLKRVMASGFVAVGGAALFIWIWPNDSSIAFEGVAVMSAMLSVVVVVSLWQK